MESREDEFCINRLGDSDETISCEKHYEQAQVLAPSHLGSGLLLAIHGTAGKRSSRKLAASGTDDSWKPGFHHTQFSETGFLSGLPLLPLFSD